jgi:hypothetical protein
MEAVRVQVGSWQACGVGIGGEETYTSRVSGLDSCVGNQLSPTFLTFGFSPFLHQMASALLWGTHTLMPFTLLSPSFFFLDLIFLSAAVAPQKNNTPPHQHTHANK